jgi:ADP-ribose pyrophosphatase
MERVGGQLVYRGPAASVRMDMFKYADGETAERQIVLVPDSVTIAAHDGETLFMVRQPREAVGEEALLELPAGKLDVEGEPPLETAKRELAEEIGKAAERWESLGKLYTSPGFADEQVEVFLASGLSDASAESEENERIEIIEWPLDRLDEAIDDCHDGKSLAGLFWLRRRLRS